MWHGFEKRSGRVLTAVTPTKAGILSASLVGIQKIPASHTNQWAEIGHTQVA